MVRWSRSRLRVSGIGVVAFLGGSLIVVPAVSGAQDEPAAARPTAVAANDRIAMIAGKNGRSAFEFKPGSGDRNAPFAFVATGGTVRAQRMGGGVHPVVQAETGAPMRAVQAAAAEPTYVTTFTVNSQNWTAWNKFIGLWNRDTWTYVPVPDSPNSLSATVSLPPGNYYVTAMYGIYGVNSYLLTKPFTVTDRAQAVRLDEASAKEVALTVDETTAQRYGTEVWMAFPNGDVAGFAGGYQQTRTYVTTTSVAGTTLRVHDVLTKAGSSASKPSPYRYDLVKSWPHPLPASPVAAVPTASLASTTTTIRAQGINASGSYLTAPMTGDNAGAFLSTAVRVPATFTEYVTPGVTMSRLVYYGDWQSLNLPSRTLPSGTSPDETVGVGPLVPIRTRYNPSKRYLNRMEINEEMALADAAGNTSLDNASTTSMTLSSGGQVLKTANAPSLSVDVPPAQQTYQLEQKTTRKASWSQLSTKVHSEWMFVSAGPTNTTLPLMDLAMAASGLDQRNRSGSAPVVLTVVPSTRRISAASAVDKVEWSLDDGATWAELPLAASGEGFKASMDVPATAAFVSLRVTASNDQGGALRRTVLRALAGPATGGDEFVGSTTISNVRVNDGKALVPRTPDPASFTATFTASDPSGIASAGLYLWHGSYNTPDGVLTAHTGCVPVDATTSTCSAQINIFDIRYSLASNALAGTWRVAAWALAKDGTGFTDRHEAGSVAIKRATRLTMDATPEPVKKGKTLTLTGVLSAADWESWRYEPYAPGTVKLQWAVVKTPKWTTAKLVKADANGQLRTTVTAGSSLLYRFNYAGDAASDVCTSAMDYVQVR